MIPRLRPANGTVIPVIYLFVLLLITRVPLRAQNPIFADTPDGILDNLPRNHPEMPFQTGRDIAVIEANAPSYLATSDREGRLSQLNAFIDLEEECRKPVPDLRPYWPELLLFKAPMLREDQIDAVAWDWWNAMGNQAIAHEERGGHDELRDAGFKEVRAHFQTLRTGSDAQAKAAMRWLTRAEVPDGWKRLRPLPDTPDFSPLAHLLARDISQELTVYGDAEAAKLRNAVKRLVASKFRITDENGMEHVLVEADVDALLDKFSSNPEDERRALAILEEWLKRAIDADLQRFEDAARAYSRSH